MAGHPLKSVVRQIRRLVSSDAVGDPTDWQLLDRFLFEQDEDAFAAIVQRHGPLVVSVCRRILDNGHDADDAFQATFLVLARKAGGIRRDSLTGWLYGVASRVALRMRSDLSQRQFHEKKATDMREPRTEQAACWHDLRPVLDEEVNRLPDKYRLPIVLHYFQGKSTEEAAREMGCPAGSLTWRLMRARELLRDRLARRGVVVPAALLSVCLTENAGSAAVPAALATSTIPAAIGFAAGQAAEAISAQAALYAQGVLRAMFFTKLRKLAAMLAALCILGTGLGLATWLPAREGAPKEQADFAGKERPPGKIEFKGRISNPVFSADGRILAYSCDPVNDPSNRVLKPKPNIHVLWDVAAGKEIAHLEDTTLDDPFLAGIGLSPDGKKLAVAMGNTSVRIWDLVGRKEISRLTDSQPVSRVAFSSDGRTVAAMSAAEKGLRLWDAASGKEVRQFEGTPGGFARELFFSADRASLLGVLVSMSKKTPGKAPGPWVYRVVGHRWDVATGKHLRELGEAITGESGPLPTDLPSGLAEIAGGKQLVLWAERTVQVCDANTGKKIREFKVPGEADAAKSTTTHVAISSAAPVAAAATKDTAAGPFAGLEISVWDMAAAKRLWRVDSGCYHIRHLVFSPEGATLVIIGRTSDQSRDLLMIYDLSATIPREARY